MVFETFCPEWHRGRSFIPSSFPLPRGYLNLLENLLWRYFVILGVTPVVVLLGSSCFQIAYMHVSVPFPFPVPEIYDYRGGDFSNL